MKNRILSIACVFIFLLAIIHTPSLGSDINRDDDCWYLNQLYSGNDANINCGPAVAVMAAKWFDSNFTGTIRQARGSQPDSRGEGWFYRNICTYLEANDVNITYSYSFTTSKAIELLNENRIIITGILTSDIAFRNDETQIGRYYYIEYGSGHFIILKGYSIIDDVGYFEVYDPYTGYHYYSDGSPMGKDRLYPADEIEKSVRGWWDSEYIVVNPPSNISVTTTSSVQ